MDMNKKKIIIAAAIVLVLILVVSIAIILLENQHETQNISYNINGTNLVTETNEIENQDQNETSNETENSEKTIEGEITYVEAEDGVQIPIPPIFTYIGGSSSTGAVIEDEDGNQFVWVPVSSLEDYHREIFEVNGDEVTLEDMENLNLDDSADYDSTYDDSILNYGGFYVARYEAGEEDGIGTPVSKADVLPWTQLTWQKAKDLSTEMYAENDCFQTDLINSYAWDTICNWIKNSGSNIDDSTDYGNYQNSSNGLNKVVETGSNKKWVVNNIYDMAGNVWEYTTEQYGDHTKYHVGRGGGYWNYGNLYPISTRGTTEDVPDINIGFRVVLYLK